MTSGGATLDSGGELAVTAGGPLRGELRVPGDKSISHRALMLAALADGTSRIAGLSGGADVAATATAVAALGAEIEVTGGPVAELGAGGAVLVPGAGVAPAGGPVAGRGAGVEPAGVEVGAVAALGVGVEPAGAAVAAPGVGVEPAGVVVVRGGTLRRPAGPIDVGNSGTSIRLLAGIAAGCPFTTVLGGDASVNRRPMDRVAEPLRLMGATVEGAGGGRRAPLRITGGSLRGIRWQPPVASAQVKGAVLLAGLFAEGETAVAESIPTRAHTEEMLAAFGADVRAGGGEVVVRASRPAPFDFAVPGDPSAAAFWLVGAALVPGSEVTVHDVYHGQGRDGFLRVLARMGADLAVVPAGERRARLTCRHGPLRGVTVAASEVPDLIDEIPILAVAAAVAEGPSRFEGAGELRHKESDRLRSVMAGLAALGASAEVDGDALVVHGGARLRGGRIDAAGDHRIAMAFCIGALAAPDGDETPIDGWGSVATSYPNFANDLQSCRAP